MVSAADHGVASVVWPPAKPHHKNLFSDLVANDATNGGTANRAASATTCQYRTCDATDGCANGGVFVSRGHAGTCAERQDSCSG